MGLARVARAAPWRGLYVLRGNAASATTRRWYSDAKKETTTTAKEEVKSEQVKEEEGKKNEGEQAKEEKKEEEGKEEQKKEEQQEEVIAPRSKWKFRVAMAVLGTLGAGLYYEYFYARKLATFREVVSYVRDCPEVAGLGELEMYRWYDPRGLVTAWEWSPTSWWRRLFYPSPDPFLPVEELAYISFAMRGDSGHVSCKATLHRRVAGISKWRIHRADIEMESDLLPGEKIAKTLVNRELILPA